MIDHDEITKIMSSQGGYGKGITPNPYASQQAEYQRRHLHAATRKMLSDKIISLTEPRFLTPVETSEFIEALVSMSDSRKILEVGTHTGHTALHILRAIVGKPGAHLTSIDCRPAHDAEFFSQPTLAAHFTHLADWTPQVFSQLAGQVFDLVFLDSDHSVEHSEKERLGLIPITRPGTIFVLHDLPEWQCPVSKVNPPVVGWVNNLVATGFFRGLRLPTCEQADCLLTYGPGYPSQINPHLGLFIRN